MALGLVHELADDALARARALGEELAALPPLALAMVKRAVYEGADKTLAEGLTVEGESFLATMLSDDAQSRMREYIALPLERRAARHGRKADGLPAEASWRPCCANTC